MHTYFWISNGHTQSKKTLHPITSCREWGLPPQMLTLSCIWHTSFSCKKYHTFSIQSLFERRRTTSLFSPSFVTKVSVLFQPPLGEEVSRGNIGILIRKSLLVSFFFRFLRCFLFGRRQDMHFSSSSFPSLPRMCGCRWSSSRRSCFRGGSEGAP